MIVVTDDETWMIFMSTAILLFFMAFKVRTSSLWYIKDNMTSNVL